MAKVRRVLMRPRMRHWRVMAPRWLLSAAILLLVTCMTTASGIILLSTPPTTTTTTTTTAPNGPDTDSSFYYSNQVDYYSRQHRLYSPRRILDVEDYPRSRPAPTSYPPPKSNVQNAPRFGHSSQSPPHPP